MIIKNLNDYLRYRGCETFAEIERQTYKFTECGAWVTHNKKGFAVGSIVEGCDESTQTFYVPFPFDVEDFFQALEKVEKQASDIWKQTHGCEECWPDGYCGEFEELEFGNWPINPKCKSCKGNGVIL